MSFKNEKSNRVLEIINFICALYIVFWIISPIAIGVNYLKALVILSVILWMITSMIICKSVFFGNKVISILTYLAIAYIAFVGFLSEGAIGFSKNVDVIIFLFLLLFYLFYKDRFFIHLKMLFIFSLVLIAIFAVITFIAHIGQPVPISRYITGGKLPSDLYYAKGVGGYNFIFTAACALILVFHLLYSKKYNGYFKKSSQKDIANMVLDGSLLLLLIAIILLLFISKFTFAIGAAGLGIIILLFSKFKFKVNLIIAAALILIISAFITMVLTGVLYVPPQELWRDNWSNLVFKAYSVIQSVKTGELTGAVAHRWMYYQQSLAMIPSHLLVGTIFDTNASVGGHSFVLDNIAEFGLIIGMLINGLCLYVPFVNIYHKEKGWNSLALAIAFAVLFLLIFDTLAQGIAVIVFIGLNYLSNQKTIR